MGKARTNWTMTLAAVALGGARLLRAEDPLAVRPAWDEGLWPQLNQPLLCGPVSDSEPAALADQRRLVISIPDRRIVLLVNGRVERTYDVAVGKSSTPSPTGSYTVAIRLKQPVWWGPHGVVPPGKANPLGPRWIGLSLKGYGIHGTNQPKSIGKAASKGCIRMRNADVEELYELVRLGDAVELYDELPAELAAVFAPDPVAALVLGGEE